MKERKLKGKEEEFEKINGIIKKKYEEWQNMKERKVKGTITNRKESMIHNI